MEEKADVLIGKFDILATYACARTILDGAPVAEAKECAFAAGADEEDRPKRSETSTVNPELVPGSRASLGGCS
jgi:hypothetical protein